MAAKAVAGPIPGPPAAGRRVLPRKYAFWAMATMLFFMGLANVAPSPMYAVYQHSWKFSPIVLTSVFASSSLALLVTLLFVGSLSDHIGRRPVLLVAAVVELLGMGAFEQATSVGWLFAARILQGVAMGMASGAIGATMLDLQAPGSHLAALMTNVAASGGGAIGAGVTGLLVQFAPWPTKLVFWILIASFFVLFLVVIVLPETVENDGRWRETLPPKVSVPGHMRGTFLTVAPAIFASWALAGLYLSLGPSIVSALSASPSRLTGAAVIVVLNGTATLVALVGRGWTPERSLYLGSGALVVGVGLAILALQQRQVALFFVATAVAGGGFGPSFSGSLRILTGLAPADSRAEVVTAIYVASYLGLSVPAVIAGFSVVHAGLFPTAYGYGIGLIVLTAVAVGGTLRERRHVAERRALHEPLCGHHDLPPCVGSLPTVIRHAEAAA